MSLDDQAKKTLRRLGAFRDLKISKLEDQASEAERLFFDINGKDESKRYFEEYARLTLEAEHLKREPIRYRGQEFYVYGGEISSITPE
jgi:hypothetical protein